MALDPQKDLKTIQQLNAEIDSLYKRLGRQDTPPIFDASKIGSARREIKKLNEDLDDVNNSLSFISKSFRDSIAELSKQNTELGYAKKSLRSIESISRSIAYENSQGLLISDKTLNSLEKKAKLEYQSLQIAVDSGRIKGKELKEFKENLATQKEFLETMERIRNQTKMVREDLGVKTFSFFDDLTSKIPGLAALSEPFKAAREEAERAGKSNVELFGQSKPLQKKQLDALKEAAKTGKGLTQDKIKELGLEKLLTSQAGKTLSGKVASQKAGKLLGSAASAAGQSAVSPLMAGLKSIGPAISGMLKKVLGPVGLLIELFEAIKASDAAVADMAKNFGMTYNEARDLKSEMTSVATSSGDIFVTSKGVLETFTAINGALGTNAMLSDEMSISFTKLREKAGFTNEELQGIARIQLGTKNTTEDITGQFLAQAKVSSLKNGVIMNEQKMLKEIGKVSAATTLSLSKNPGLIGQAVATAKSLGMEMAQVDAIAGSLLDFESSIENELSAELLLNKDLNLEKARQAALNNDLATVAEEIANQVGSSAEFSEMNRIQQEALAKSVGMSREDLAESLLLRDQLQGLTAEDAALETKKFEQLKGQVGEQEAMRILQEQGVEGLDKQVGMADKMNAQMEKLKEIFVIVGEALMPILDIFVSIFDLIGPIMKFLDPMIQTILVGVAALTDLVKGAAFLANKLFGDGKDKFESATKKQIQKAEGSAQKNYGVSGDAFGEDQSIRNRAEMAAGGIVTGPTNALVGEAGPEAVIPLSGNSPSIKVDNSETNALLKQLIRKTPEMAPLGLYEVQ
jgi:hypothetical protein